MKTKPCESEKSVHSKQPNVTAPSRHLDSGGCPLHYAFPLKHGQKRGHMKLGASGRGFGINCIGETLKADSVLLKIVRDFYKIADAPASPGEIPHDEYVAGLQGFQTMVESGVLFSLDNSGGVLPAILLNKSRLPEAST